jgi:hypothetical protein
VIFRKRFGELIDRQLTMFETDHAELVERITRASEAYDDAPRDEAEERYGDEVAFNYAVLRRFGDLALELEDEPDA